MGVAAIPHGVAATTLDDDVRQTHGSGATGAVVAASLGGLIVAVIADGAGSLVLVNPLPSSPWHRHCRCGIGRKWCDGIEARLVATCDALPDADDATDVAAGSRTWGHAGCGQAFRPSAFCRRGRGVPCPAGKRWRRHGAASSSACQAPAVSVRCWDGNGRLLRSPPWRLRGCRPGECDSAHRPGARWIQHAVKPRHGRCTGAMVASGVQST